MQTEIAITRLEIPNPTAITKRLEYGCGRVRFGVDGIHHLADGRTVPTRVSADRKKDVPRAIERETNAAAQGACTATFDDAGKYTGTITRFIIGGGGLVPLSQVDKNPLPNRDSVLPEVPSHRARGIKALDRMAGFIGQNQRRCVDDLLRGEEAEYFANRMTELADLIEKMPSTGQTDGQGQDAIAQLHYFAGGSANWWITEKDKGAPDDEENGIPPQSQAFGLANLFGGPTDQDAELGYISIAEILENGGELDFHFTPRTLRKLQHQDETEPETAPAFDLDAITEEVNDLLGVPADVPAAAFDGLPPDDVPKNTPYRETAISAILAASRRPCPPIVERFYSLCSDGQYRSPWGIPHGVSTVPGADPMFMGCVFQQPDGSTVGTLDGKNREELAADWEAAQDIRGAEFRATLEGMTEAELDEQAAYWLHSKPAGEALADSARVDTAKTGSDAPESPETGKSGTVRINRQHAGVEIAFPGRPADSVISSLKAAKFRWSRRTRVWYRKASAHVLAAAVRITGTGAEAAAALSKQLEALSAAEGPDASDLAYEDACAARCGL